MRRYLSILEGPTPRAAVPILATEDPEIIEAVAGVLVSRLQAEHSEDRRAPAQLARERFRTLPGEAICARPGCGKPLPPTQRQRGSPRDDPSRSEVVNGRASSTLPASASTARQRGITESEGLTMAWKSRSTGRPMVKIGDAADERSLVEGTLTGIRASVEYPDNKL